MHRLFQVDSFTLNAFKGNPAGVCLLTHPVEAEWMQNVAAEMNVAETAFILKTQDHFDLRWFAPKSEVELCGHATLASAHILWQEGICHPAEQIQFKTLSGTLIANKVQNKIELDFPTTPVKEISDKSTLERVVAQNILYAGKNRFDFLVQLDGEEKIRNFNPDFEKIKSLGNRGLIITSRADSGNYDFVSRFFAPTIGIDEDPVTGSAHCTLGPFWQDRLQKSEFLGYQASARGGEVNVKVQNDRAILGGQAVTVFRGDIIV